MNTPQFNVILLAVFCGTLLMSCSGSSSGELSSAIASTAATYQIVDLQTGQVSAAGSIPDLQTNSAYTTSKMVFRRVAVGATTIGSASDSYAAQSDEVQQSVDVGAFYIAVFEVTQAQWAYMDSSRPWQDLQWANLTLPVTNQDNLPAWGISVDRARSVLANYQRTYGTPLELPSSAEWECACRAGSSTAFSWGDANDAATSASFAAVFETQAGSMGPRTVGGRQANALGLYDMHGNLWEISNEGELRGGSWFEPIALARSANKAAIDSDAAHGLVGLRPVYRP